MVTFHFSIKKYEWNHKNRCKEQGGQIQTLTDISAHTLIKDGIVDGGDRVSGETGESVALDLFHDRPLHRPNLFIRKI